LCESEVAHLATVTDAGTLWLSTAVTVQFVAAVSAVLELVTPKDSGNASIAVRAGKLIVRTASIVGLTGEFVRTVAAVGVTAVTDPALFDALRHALIEGIAAEFGRGAAQDAVSTDTLEAVAAPCVGTGEHRRDTPTATAVVELCRARRTIEVTVPEEVDTGVRALTDISHILQSRVCTPIVRCVAETDTFAGVAAWRAAFLRLAVIRGFTGHFLDALVVNLFEAWIASTTKGAGGVDTARVGGVRAGVGVVSTFVDVTAPVVAHAEATKAIFTGTEEALSPKPGVRCLVCADRADVAVVQVVVGTLVNIVAAVGSHAVALEADEAAAQEPTVEVVDAFGVVVAIVEATPTFVDVEAHASVFVPLEAVVTLALGVAVIVVDAVGVVAAWAIVDALVDVLAAVDDHAPTGEAFAAVLGTAVGRGVVVHADCVLVADQGAVHVLIALIHVHAAPVLEGQAGVTATLPAADLVETDAVLGAPAVVAVETLVDVVTSLSVAFEAIVTDALAAPGLVDALRVIVASAVVAIGAFVGVDTVLTVAGEAVVTDALVVPRSVDAGGVFTAFEVTVGALVDVIARPHAVTFEAVFAVAPEAALGVHALGVVVTVVDALATLVGVDAVIPVELEALEALAYAAAVLFDDALGVESTRPVCTRVALTQDEAVLAVAPKAGVTHALVGTGEVVTGCIRVTESHASFAFVDVDAVQARAIVVVSVAEITPTGIRAELLDTALIVSALDLAAGALVGVITVDPVPFETVVTRTREAAGIIVAGGVGVTVVEVVAALVQIGTLLAITDPACVAGTHTAAIDIPTPRVGIAAAVIHGALVDVIAHLAVSFEAGNTAAIKAPEGIDAVSIVGAVIGILSTFVDVVTAVAVGFKTVGAIAVETTDLVFAVRVGLAGVVQTLVDVLTVDAVPREPFVTIACKAIGQIEAGCVDVAIIEL